MLRGIVLGDLWGIDKNDWIELWAGLLGAIPAAIISAAVAAWVAVTVLNKSNTHQKTLMEEQLAEQRKESEQVRRSIVLADLLGAASGFRGASDMTPEAVERQRLLFESQAFRWELEERDLDNTLEILKWGNTLWKPAMAIARITSAPAQVRATWGVFFQEVETAFNSACLGLGFASDGQRPVMLKRMAERRDAFDLRWESLLKNLSDEIDLPRSGGAGAS